MSALLEARAVSYAYPGAADVSRSAKPMAVHAVSLEVEAASMTAVIGANGSGKSTFIRMLAGLLRPAVGEILLHGKPLDRWQPRLRAREIAYMPQTTAAAFPFPVMDIVLSGRSPHIPRFHFDRAEDYTIALDALEAAGAVHLAGRSVMSLSAGERQMVVLARALAQQPRLLLLDEPSSALDLKHRAALMRTLARLRESRGLSIVMITHDLQLTGSLFDRILALRDGEVAALGRPDEVLRSDLLSEIYGEPNVRARRMGDQTLVWIEA